MELTLKRVYLAPDYTIGRLYANQILVCDTIEDCDRGLKSSWSAQQILKVKVYGETAIPKGRYRIRLTVSPKFKYRVWGKKYGGIVPEVDGVKCYSGVRIHPANRATELLGCIAPGKNTKKGMVTSSQQWYYTLMDNYIIPANERGEDIYLTIQ
jgi:hypothetical protein